MKSDAPQSPSYPPGISVFPGGVAILDPKLLHSGAIDPGARDDKATERSPLAFDHLCNLLRGDPRVQTIQCLLDPSELSWEADLVRQGFRQVADLGYLMCRTRPHAAAPPADGELDFRPYRADRDAERLARIVESTYEDSRDCPRLQSKRSTTESLESYRAVGASGDRWWWILEHRSTDVGCLLLADHPSQQQWELVYVGIAPPFRGRRWGLLATRFALQEAASHGRDRLVLSVDLANEPACSMYARLGFEAFDLRRVLVCDCPKA